MSCLYYGGNLVSLVVTKLHVCHQLRGAGQDRVRILIGLNFSGSAGGVSDHAYISGCALLQGIK